MYADHLKAATAAAALAICSAGLAETVSLEPSKDNTLYESAAGELSNGAGDYIFAGVTAMNSIRRAVLAFDVAGNVPAGSTINSAELTLHMSMTQAAEQPMSLHRLSANWGEGNSDATFGGGGAGADAEEGDATWLHQFYPDDMWNNAGGDYESTPSVTINVDDDGFYTWASNANLVADVQGWLDEPSSNFGWILIGNESTALTAKRFDSGEHPTPTNRPELVINYTPPTKSCTGDTNEDGQVNVSDLLELLSAWGPCANCPEDLDGNDVVDVNDLLDLLANWGPCP